MTQKCLWKLHNHILALFPAFSIALCMYTKPRKRSGASKQSIQSKSTSKHQDGTTTQYILLSLTKQQQKNHPWFIVNIVSKVWTTKKNSKHPHLPVEEQAKQSNPTVLLSMQKNSNSAAQLDGNGLYYFKNSVGYNYM